MKFHKWNELSRTKTFKTPGITSVTKLSNHPDRSSQNCTPKITRPNPISPFQNLENPPKDQEPSPSRTDTERNKFSWIGIISEKEKEGRISRPPWIPRIPFGNFSNLSREPPFSKRFERREREREESFSQRRLVSLSRGAQFIRGGGSEIAKRPLPFALFPSSFCSRAHRDWTRVFEYFAASRSFITRNRALPRCLLLDRVPPSTRQGFSLSLFLLVLSLRVTRSPLVET